MIIKFKLFENKYSIEDPLGIFNIGDRVICNGFYEGIKFDNEIGTIISFYSTKTLKEVLVKFDNRFSSDLYSGDNNEDPDRSSAYLSHSCIELIDKKPHKIRWYKKGKLTENANELDPLGEENWDDDIEYKIGDKLISKHDVYTSSGKYWHFHKNQIYTIHKVNHLQHGTVYLIMVSCGQIHGFSKEYLDINFTKVIRESINELDPFGEEDWNDKYIIRQGDFLKCKKNYSWAKQIGDYHQLDSRNKKVTVNEFIEGKAYRVERSFIDPTHPYLNPMKGRIYMAGEHHLIYFDINKNDTTTPYIYEYFENPDELK